MLKFDPGGGSLLLSYPCSKCSSLVMRLTPVLISHSYVDRFPKPTCSMSVGEPNYMSVTLTIETFTTTMPAIALSSDFPLTALTIHFIGWLPPALI